MIKNYLKIAVRNLFKSKVHSLINIVGLSVGMAVAILLGLWIWDELSFDKYHQNYDRIVMVMQHQKFNGEWNTGSSMPIPLGYKLRDDYKSDFKYVALIRPNEHTLNAGAKKLNATGLYAQPDLPLILSLKMLTGNLKALNDQSSILLSESMAISLFGKADPINQLLKIDNKWNVKVAGVYEDLPKNTTLADYSAFMASWDLYMTTAGWLKDASTNWGNNSWP